MESPACLFSPETTLVKKRVVSVKFHAQNSRFGLFRKKFGEKPDRKIAPTQVCPTRVCLGLRPAPPYPAFGGQGPYGASSKSRCRLRASSLQACRTGKRPAQAACRWVARAVRFSSTTGKTILQYCTKALRAPARVRRCRANIARVARTPPLLHERIANWSKWSRG